MKGHRKSEPSAAVAAHVTCGSVGFERGAARRSPRAVEVEKRLHRMQRRAELLPRQPRTRQGGLKYRAQGLRIQQAQAWKLLHSLVKQHSERSGRKHGGLVSSNCRAWERETSYLHHSCRSSHRVDKYQATTGANFETPLYGGGGCTPAASIEFFLHMLFPPSGNIRHKSNS